MVTIVPNNGNNQNLSLPLEFPPNLQELDLWGGDFYSDGLFPILTHLGPQLTKLNLVSIYASNIHHTFVLQGSRGGARQPSPHHFVTKHP